MSVITNNSNSSTMSLGGLIWQYPLPPWIFGSGTTVTNTVLVNPIKNLPQVIGLVPLFPCCDAPTIQGALSFTVCDGNTVYNLVVGGHNYGNFTVVQGQSNATIAASINAILTGSGLSVACANTGLLITAVLSGGFNGQTIVLTKVSGCGSVGKNVNVKGGVVDCLECDCREGKYAADAPADDRDFTLPVFADVTCTDSFHNDSNSWLIQYPGTYDPIANGDFKLQELIGGVWTSIATLNNTSYGTPYNLTSLGNCNNTNYGGYLLNWNKVLAAFGEGTYRFYAAGNYTSSAAYSYCMRSPPFCLRAWDCNLVDGTVKFEANYSGGNFGSVTNQGTSWSLCCSVVSTGGAQGTTTVTTPIAWYDSIRFFGFFGKEGAEYTRDQIKYATGAINKIRDEAIKTFEFQSSQLPMWFHRRFYSYGLMADQLYVSDYNLNNTSYEYKHFWVVADSNYQPKYIGATRYPKVYGIKFREGDQFVFRDRCC